MSKLQKFATVNGVEVMLFPGQLGVEPSLHFQDGEKLVEMTLSSNEYENELGTFRLHTGLTGEQRENAEKAMEFLADEVFQVGPWTDFTLKKEHHENLLEIVNELIVSGDY